MGFGTVVPEGHLPVFSTDTEEQARKLLVAACGTNMQRQFVARELAEEQTVENLIAFGERLAETAERMNLFGDDNGGSTRRRKS